MVGNNYFSMKTFDKGQLWKQSGRQIAFHNDCAHLRNFCRRIDKYGIRISKIFICCIPYIWPRSIKLTNINSIQYKRNFFHFSLNVGIAKLSDIVINKYLMQFWHWEQKENRVIEMHGWVYFCYHYDFVMYLRPSVFTLGNNLTLQIVK